MAPQSLHSDDSSVETVATALELAHLRIAELQRQLAIAQANHGNDAEFDAKKALQQSEERFRVMTEASPDAIGILRNGLTIYVNPAAVRLFGATSSEQLLGKLAMELVHPDCREIVQERLRRVAAGDKSIESADLLYLKLDGTPIDVEALATLINYDGEPAFHVVVKDITERKRAEARLRASEQSYRALVTKTPHITIVIRNGAVVFANPAAIKFFGANRASQLDGLSPFKMVHPDSLAQALERLQAVMRGDPTPVAELKYLKLDGSIAYVESVSTLISFEGKPAVQVSILDVTSRRLEAQSLIESEQRYRTLIEKTPEAMAVIKRGLIVFINPAALKVFGIQSHSEVVNRSPLSFVVPGLRALSIERLKRTYAGETVEPMELEMYRVDGTSIYVESTTTLINFDGGPAVQVVVRDISNARRAREVIEQSEKFLATIAENVPGILSYWTTDLYCTFANSAYQRFLGLTKEQLIGARMQDVVPSEHLEAAVCNATLALEGTQVSDPLAYITPSGEEKSLLVQYICDYDGANPRGVFCLGIDITKMVDAEKQIIAAKAQAEAANNAKSRFLAAASHDLRQPMTNISACVQFLAKQVGKEHQRLITLLQHSVEGMSELLSNLLDVSKYQAGIVKPVITDFYLDELMALVANNLNPEAAARGLKLRVRHSGVDVRTDRNIMLRILSNLVSNAIRYTNTGGVLIAARRRDGRLWLEVTDTGIGIPKDRYADVFEEFLQLGDNARNLGSGLGLAIVAKSCDLLGLEIRLKSRVGKGSVFAVELPQGNVCINLATFEKPSSHHKPLCIAFVEDNTELIEIFRYIFTQKGHVVVAGPSWKAIRYSFDAGPPDIVISDYRLESGVTGFDVIAKARLEFGSNLPALLFTGDTDPELIKILEESGIDVIYKPKPMDVVEEAIYRTLATRKSANASKY